MILAEHDAHFQDVLVARRAESGDLHELTVILLHLGVLLPRLANLALGSRIIIKNRVVLDWVIRRQELFAKPCSTPDFVRDTTLFATSLPSTPDFVRNQV